MRPENTEIEAKLKVDSFEPIVEMLAELDAECVSTEQQKDSYFDDENNSLQSADKGLRLRLTQSGCEEKIFLSYKGPRENAMFKRRTEIEFAVSDSQAALDFLTALGYKSSLTVEKKRQTWSFENCLICLDEVKSLGSFVEIEGPDEEKIKSVQDRLKLGNLGHIHQSYAHLLKEKK